MNLVFLTRMNKPIGILLLLWPTLSALLVAQQGIPDLRILIIFIIGTILMRSAGCIANDLADRNIDTQVDRTKNRPLATGKASIFEALLYLFILLLLSFFLVLQLNFLTIKLSIFALLSVLIYPFCKRFFALPQLMLGISFGFGILMAFTAIQNLLPFEAWALYIANIFWALSFDSHYAIKDMKDDQKINVRSSALTFKHYTIPFILMSFIFMFLILLFIGYSNDYSMSFYLFLAISLFIALRGSIRGISMDPDKNFEAFLANNYVGFFMFMAFALQMLKI
ncbi:MAG: 4-hydroxybenzoate octaprenyltransferase [Methylophilaceae bacterium]|jgi:4-hydroxybenzoate polyprenyltransferase|nr:4-hydroxybenzoate octaprenyltransferase [Methylophilaceae bacterium]